MSSHPSTDALRELMGRLWNERYLLEQLLFKLVTVRLMIAEDQRRFVTPALDEVEHVTQQMRAAELRRAVAVDVVAAEWGISAGTLDLRYLAEHAPEPAASMLAEHRESLSRLAAEVVEASTEWLATSQPSLTDFLG